MTMFVFISRKTEEMCSLLFVSMLAVSCMAGGGFDKDGRTQDFGYLPAATRTGNQSYSVICLDEEEIQKREEEKKSPPPDYQPPAAPPFKEVAFNKYQGGCEAEGESSQFFLLHLFPVTPPLSLEAAVSQAVQGREGDTMIGIRYRREIHYFAGLGHVVVYKIKGDVIRFHPYREQVP